MIRLAVVAVCLASTACVEPPPAGHREPSWPASLQLVPADYYKVRAPRAQDVRPRPSAAPQHYQPLPPPQVPVVDGTPPDDALLDALAARAQEISAGLGELRRVLDATEPKRGGRKKE